MTLLNISQLLRSSGPIWLIEFPDYGIEFRANVNEKQVRVVIPRPSQSMPINVPDEPDTLLHVVKTLPALKIWLEETIWQE